jgi:glycine cleavage system H protein
MTAVFVLVTIVFCLSLDHFLARARARKAAPATVPAFAAADYEVRPGRFLAPGHTWLSVNEDGDARIGVSELAQRALGRPGEVLLPEPGTKVRKGEPLFSFARDGRKLTFRSPVTGIVTAINPKPEVAGDNWLLTMEPARLSPELKTLHIAEEAVAFMKREAARFRDFLLESFRLSPAMATLPDGGVPADGVLRHLPADVTAAFEDEFLRGEE